MSDNCMCKTCGNHGNLDCPLATEEERTMSLEVRIKELEGELEREAAELRASRVTPLVESADNYIAELKSRIAELEGAIRNQCANLCTEAYTSRGKHHHDCLVYELAEGSEG